MLGQAVVLAADFVAPCEHANIEPGSPINFVLVLKCEAKLERGIAVNLLSVLKRA